MRYNKNLPDSASELRRFMDDAGNKPGLAELAGSYPVRLVLYGLATLVVYQLVYMLIQIRGAHWLAAENGALEVMQVVCALFAVSAILIGVRWTPVGRAALVGAAGLILYAAARESDTIFESLFFDDAYKWLVGLPLAVVITTVVYQERNKILAETLFIAERPGATMFAIGGIYLCFFCQMTDRPLFWSPTGENAFVSDQKALVEESAELFAYMLLAFSGIEVMISARQDRRTAEQALNVEDHTSGTVRISQESEDRLAA